MANPVMVISSIVNARKFIGVREEIEVLMIILIIGNQWRDVKLLIEVLKRSNEIINY